MSRGEIAESNCSNILKAISKISGRLYDYAVVLKVPKNVCFTHLAIFNIITKFSFLIQ